MSPEEKNTVYSASDLPKSLRELRKEVNEQALALLLEHPEYNNTHIERLTGCRYERIRLLRKNLEKTGVIEKYDGRNGGRNRKQKVLAHLVASKTDEAVEEEKNVASWVYAIAPVGGGLTKIGLTINVEHRLAALQFSSPLKLVVLWQTQGDKRLEERLHRIFSDRRAWGEWFDLGSDPVTTITFALKWWDENPHQYMVELPFYRS